MRSAQQIALVGSFELDVPSCDPIYWSDQCFRIFGLDPEDGLPSREFYMENLVVAEDLERSRKYVHRCALEGKSIDYEYRVRRRDGTVRWGHCQAHPVFDSDGNIVSVQGTFQDITARKEAELRLLASEEKFRTIFETVPDCVKVLDAEGNLVDMNAAGLSLIEADCLDQIHGESVYSLLAPEHHDSFRTHERAVHEGQSNTQEFEIIGLNGTRRWMWSKQVPIHSPQGPAVLAVTRDITERRRNDEAIRALVEGTSETGPKFFPSFARALARVFQSRYILVCEHITATRCRTLAFWNQDQLGQNVEYEMTGGPCAETATGEMTFFRQGIQKLFPDDTDLVDMEAESYCGIPFFDSNGDTIGHLAILDDRPMDLNLCEMPILRIFVARAAAELERKLIENELTESQTRLMTVVQDAPVVMTSIRHDGQITLFDGRALQSVGFETGQFVGQNYFELWKDAPALVNSMRACLDGDIPEPTQTQVGTRMLETHYSPVRTDDDGVTGAITVCVDVTERIEAENQLRDKHNLLDSIMAGTTDAVFVKDIDGHYVMANAAAATIVGRSSTEMIGLTDMDLFPPEIASEFMKTDRTVIEAGRDAVVEENVRVAGSDEDYTFLSTKAPYRDADGEVIGIIGIARNITQRKETEDELRALQDRLTHVMRMSTMGEMATGLAHELNQPLAAMSSYAYAGEQLLLNNRQPDPERLRQLFSKLGAQAHRAGEIIRRLRALVGSRPSHRVSVAISDPILEVIQLLQSQLREAEITCRLETDAGNAHVVIDEIQIQQVLVNVIRNAVDAMIEGDSGGRDLTVSTRMTDVDRVEVAVRDTGIGVESDDRDRLFDAFFSTKDHGMGMGLAISRTIIDSHGGRLWFTENDDQGITVRFALPVVGEKSGDARDE